MQEEQVGGNRFHRVLQSATSFAIVVTDRDGRVTDWNRGAEVILGWPFSEVVGQSAEVIFTPEDREAGRMPTEMALALKEGQANDERWHVRRDGSRFWASGELMPLHEDGGTHVGFVKILRDRTDQYAAREDLIRSEERYRALFDAVDDGFCIIEFFDGPHGPMSDYVHVEANPGYERQTGIPDIVGRTLRDLAPDEADGWAELYGNVLRTGAPIRFERDFVAAGRVIEVSAARIEPASRRQVSVLFRDISARRQAEARLRESEERFRLAVEVGEVGVFDLNLGSGELVWDDRVRAAFGVQTGRIVKQAEKVGAVHPDDRPGFDRAFAETMAGGTFDLQFRTIGLDDGVVRWVLMQGRMIEGTSGDRNFVGAVRDVSERVVAEERRAVLNRELAHRLKNTLAIVQSIATQTLRTTPDIATARKALTDRIGALATAHDILLTGRRDAGDLRTIVEGATALHDGGGRVRLSGPEVILGPKAALTLSLIVHELATNAGKYGGLSVETGHVDVAWKIAPAPEARRSLLAFEWRETGGPSVAPPAKKSFGTRLIEMGLSGSAEGTSELDYAPEGLRCRITASLTELQTEEEAIN